jgi:hypothetical protein
VSDATKVIDFAALAAPFKPEQIEWRVGSTNADKTKGMALGFIDSRTVMNRLDQVCGPENWSLRFSHADTERTVCEIGIRINGEFVWKADGCGDTDVEAEKGAMSTAIKRAAVHWGIGRYLYDLPVAWVQIQQYGRSYKIADLEMDKLRGSLKQTTVQKPNFEPGVFWKKPKLTITLPSKLVPTDDNGPSDEALIYIADKINAGIERAPTRELLAKLQDDNKQWFARLPQESVNAITENFVIRAQQFETIEGKK